VVEEEAEGRGGGCFLWKGEGGKGGVFPGSSHSLPAPNTHRRSSLSCLLEPQPHLPRRPAPPPQALRPDPCWGPLAFAPTASAPAPATAPAPAPALPLPLPLQLVLQLALLVYPESLVGAPHWCAPSPMGCGFGWRNSCELCLVTCDL